MSVIQPTNILTSTKREGRYEKSIIHKLKIFFENQDFHVIPHARFNIAWGSMLSDLDLLLIKDNMLTLVEVKSSKDNIGRVKKQFHSIQDYVDYYYIATDFLPKKIPLQDAGWILVTENIEIKNNPKKLERFPTLDSVLLLKKQSLHPLLGISESEAKQFSKYELAYKITQKSDKSHLKDSLKAIVTCNS